MSNSKITFICGEDDFLVKQCGATLFNAWTKDLQQELSKEIVSGLANQVSEVEAAVDQVCEALLTLPLFGERKVVWFKGINFLADSPLGQAAATGQQVERLQRILETRDLSEVRLLMTACPIDRRRKAVKWFQSHTDYQYSEALQRDPGRLQQVARTQCEKEGIQIDPHALTLLIERVHGNTRLVAEEIHKLSTYLGPEGGTIDEKQVLQLVPPFGENDFFEVVEAFYALDFAWTIDALKRYFLSYKEARPLLTTLQNRNRLLMQLRVLIDAKAIDPHRIDKQSLETAASRYRSHFGDANEKTTFNVFTQHPWYLGRLAKTAVKLPLRKWIDFQMEFIHAFHSLLSHPTEQEWILRHLAVKCLQPS